MNKGVKDAMIKQVYLADKGHLVDAEGVRYIRKKPVLKLECKMTSKGSNIHPKYFEQQLLELQREGHLKKGLYAANAFLVANRRNIHEKTIINRSWGPTQYNFIEVCEIELYDLSDS